MSATAKTVKKKTATAKTAKTAKKRSTTAKKRSTTAKVVKNRSEARARPIDVTPEERRRMIEESAYFRAEQRGFTEGNPVSDWLRSEREIDKLLSQRVL